ncbi:MAG: DUF6399 domain-containing protein [Cyanobacteria bacterium P01_G01_bin.38]
MSQTIRERGKKVFQAVKEKSCQGLEAIARATGMSKSSVHRHQKGIERRNQYPESEFWESEAGSAWLKLLVFGSIFFFGIKHGIGVGELSAFLKALRLGLHVGCSPSALEKLKDQMKAAITAYEVAQAEHCQPCEGQGIGVGSDEVFFGLPVLVLMELGSGYIFTEVQSEDHTYETWKAQIQKWWSQSGWHCHFMVSDRAKALIKLATEELGCVSVADLFHALRSLGQPIGSALGRQQARFAKQNQTLQAKWETAKTEAKRDSLAQSLKTLSTQQATVCQDQQQYHEVIRTLSLSIHPFDLERHETQTWNDLETDLVTPLAQLRTLAQTYGGAKAIQAIEAFDKQLPDIAQGIHTWWLWVTQALATQTASVEVQNWVIGTLLPWVYWLVQTDKTHQPELKSRYQQATDNAAQQLLGHPLTQTMGAAERQIRIDWARWMVSNYQRTSSGVEGRNGYLTRLHHSGRGFSEQTLKALTIIHNFHLKRSDGTTAAQRLFDYEFPDLFEWVVNQMGALPLARQSQKAHRPNPFHLEGFPA